MSQTLDRDLVFTTQNGQRVLPAANAEHIITRVIVRQLRRQTPGTEIGPPQCPAIVVDGRQQSCKLQIGDAVARIRIVAFQTDPAHPLVWVSTDQDVLDMRKIESMVIGRSQGNVRSVRCPPEHFHAYERDEAFMCSATLATGKSAHVLVRATDDKGSAEINLVP